MRPPADQRRRVAGMTLVEVLMVVAIVGILSALGGSAIRDMVKASRVISSSKSMLAALRGVRLRAASLNCPHYVQINGPQYAGTGSAGFPAAAGTLSIMRKGDCDSTVLSFEPGDRLVDGAHLGPEEVPDSVQLDLPTTVLATQTLTTASVVFNYDRLGARRIAIDTSGGGETGFSTVTGLDGVSVTITLHENAPTPTHSMALALPSSGTARLE